MGKMIRRIAPLVALALITCSGMCAQKASDLIPYLQAEVNEIALLSVQANYLQQQLCDPLEAALVSSYIPDHQMQASLLASTITAMGGDPATVQPNIGQPFLGTRLGIIQHDMRQHQQAVNSYKDLRGDADNDTIRLLATNGLNGAARHFSSLTVAQGATIGSPTALRDSLVASLALERSTVDNLQAQAARLNELGDQQTANLLLAQVPAHQQQAQQLESLVRQMRGNPDYADTPPAVALQTRDQILAAQRSANVQMVNTYAIQAAALPDSPIRTASIAGQQIGAQALAQLPFQTPIATVALAY